MYIVACQLRCSGSLCASTGLSRENSEHEKNPAKKSRQKSSADGKRLKNSPRDIYGFRYRL